MCLCWELSSQQSVDVIPLLCVDVRPVDVIPLFEPNQDKTFWIIGL